MDGALHDPRAAASIPRRAAAAVIDAGLLGLVVQALHWSVYAIVGSPAAEFESAVSWYAYLLATVSLPGWAYYALLEGRGRHATLGKRLLHLRVVDVYGSDIGLTRSFARNLVKLLPWEVAHVALCFPTPVFVTHVLPMPRLLFAAYALLGLYLAASLLTLKKQSVHDLAAGTYVVRAR